MSLRAHVKSRTRILILFYPLKSRGETRWNGSIPILRCAFYRPTGRPGREFLMN